MDLVMPTLNGKVAVVTGGGRGVGASIARRLAREGAAVVVADLGVELDGSGVDHGPATEVAKEVEASGGTAVAAVRDVVDYDDAGRIIDTALSRYGGLDILVNAAGILRDRMIFNMSTAEWDDVIAVHLRGTFNTTRHASAYWRENPRGAGYRLINFTSQSGLHGAPGQPNYAAAKMGVLGFTLSCANALKRYGVTSNAVSPGAETRMVASVPDERRRNPKGTPERSPDNVAPAVAYLASDASQWLNGHVLDVRAYQVTLYSNPEPIRQILSPGPWDPDDLAAAMERCFRPVVDQPAD
jgi:NAD(P)-dependent dehydrogenase (short-subunit alcohol dehydrogenase family)